MKKSIISWLAIIFLIYTTSCTNQSKAEMMPGIDIPLTEYNTKFVVTLYPGTPNSIKNGNMADFILKNQSGSSIVFSNDYGIKIFEKQTSGWKLVENRSGYADADVKFLLQTNVVNPGGLVFAASPFDPGLKSPATVRIVVIGHVLDKPDETVGAFIDMEISPYPAIEGQG